MFLFGGFESDFCHKRDRMQLKKTRALLATLLASKFSGVAFWANSRRLAKLPAAQPASELYSVMPTTSPRSRVAMCCLPFSEVILFLGELPFWGMASEEAYFIKTFEETSRLLVAVGFARQKCLEFCEATIISILAKRFHTENER